MNTIQQQGSKYICVSCTRAVHFLAHGDLEPLRVLTLLGEHLTPWRWFHRVHMQGSQPVEPCQPPVAGCSSRQVVMDGHPG